MTDEEKQLTLEEMTNLMESMTEWRRVNTLYRGENDSLKMYLSKQPGFLPWSIKGAEIEVRDKDTHIELGSVSGKEVLPVYQKAEELYNQYVKEEEQKKIEKRNGLLKKFRGKDKK